MKNYKHKEIVFLLALTLIFFWKPIINHHQLISLYNGDLVMMGLFVKAFFTTTILQYGELPLWNPNIHCGMPSLGNSNPALFYPINYLFLIVKSPFIWTLKFMLNVFLMGVFTYLFARKINLTKYSSTIAAIIYMFAGTTTVRIWPGHCQLLDAIIWFPVILYFYEDVVKTGKIKYGIYAGIAVALMFFSGHVQFVTYGLLMASIYFILRFILEYKDNKSIKPIFIYIVSLVVLFSLISIQLLPAIELSQYVDRAGGVTFEDATTFCITPQWFITFLIPTFFGTPVDETWWHFGLIWALCAYIGIMALVLSLIGLIYTRSIYRHVFLFMSIFALLFALGKYTPLYGILYTYLPGISFFRCPARILFVFTFSMSILAGFGVDFLTKRALPVHFKKITNILLVLSGISVIGTILSIVLKPYIITLGHYLLAQNYLLHPRLYMFPMTYWKEFTYTIYSTIFDGILTFTLILLSITFVFYLKYKQKITMTNFKNIIVLIIVFDLFLFGSSFVVMTDTDVLEPPEYINLIKDEGYYRVLDEWVIGQHILYPEGIEIITGYDSNYLEVYQDFLYLAENKPLSEQEPQLWFSVPKIENLNILRLLNTKYIVTETQINNTGLHELLYTNNTYVYEIIDTLPRVFMIPNATIILNKTDVAFTLQSPSFNIKEKIILEEHPNVPLNNSGQFKEANITYYSPNKIIVYINSSDPGFLVLSQVWYPGWNAYDNGVKTTLFKTNYALKSIYLLEGEHEVTFLYEPQSYKVGKYISIISLLIFTLIVLFNTKRYKT